MGPCPLGYYDTGEGFMDPKTNALYTYQMQRTNKQLTAVEVEWAVRKTRKGFEGPETQIAAGAEEQLAATKVDQKK